MATALFVCVHNAGRSQMSAALFARAAGGRHRALSAGTLADPEGRVHPEVVDVMHELGIDVSDRRPQRLSHALAEQADVVVTMGCGDSCPIIPGKRYVDWDLADPQGRPLDEVRATRDEIAGRIDELVAELDRTAGIELVAIGTVQSPLTDRASAPKQGDEGAPEAWLVLEPRVAEGLDGADVGDELLVLTWLDRARRDVLRVHPRGDPANPERGVFTTRSPDRPNPIGLHRVRVVAIDGTRLRVRDLEALDGTPILDIKPVLRSVEER